MWHYLSRKATAKFNFMINISSGPPFLQFENSFTLVKVPFQMKLYYADI